MTAIKATLFNFLDQYSQSEDITASAEFYSDLHQIITTLKLRFETEEKGILEVYSSVISQN